MRFFDLRPGARFVFAQGDDALVIARVYTKLDARTFRSEVDGTLGRVGVGDNPVQEVRDAV